MIIASVRDYWLEKQGQRLLIQEAKKETRRNSRKMKNRKRKFCRL